MKTMKLWITALLFVAGFGLALAQSNKMTRPTKVDDLLYAGKSAEAVDEFNKFKQEQLKAGQDAYKLDRLELSFYIDLNQMGGWMFPMSEETKKSYADKYVEIKQQFVKKYPNRAQSYVIQCEGARPEDVVKLATKAIALEPDNVDAYMERSAAYYALGKETEAQADEATVSKITQQAN